MRLALIRLTFTALALFLSAPASAFCGFYVGGSDAELTNDATQVALLRYGTKTVVSMQNNYDGPPEDFALVVPVPQVLQREDVRTLPEDLFEQLDRLTAPRLVQYWEKDPCAPPPPAQKPPAKALIDPPMGVSLKMSMNGGPPKVKVEAEFAVDEYDVVVLSATESTSLEDWLKQNGYRIPDGAAPYFQPYIDSGMYFFVAKVDAAKLETQPGGRAVLSPLRFQYENRDLFLPVRLGMINASGPQDLVVYVLGSGTRYEVANRENVFAPTNIEVTAEARVDFPGFYDGVFSAIMEEHPGAMVTEYAWGAAACDPCPAPVLDDSDVQTLGADTIRGAPAAASGWTITRLHTRYMPDDVGEDLVFAEATPVVGGREIPSGDGVEKGAAPSKDNAFQVRFRIRTPWSGPAECDNPRWGVWGGPPDDSDTSASVEGAISLNTRGTAPHDSSVDVASILKEPLGNIEVRPAREVSLPRATPKTPTMTATCATANGAGHGIFIGLVGLLALVARRRARTDRSR